jgi:amino acid transporter
MVFAATFHSIALKARVPPELQEGVGATWLQAGIAVALTWLTVAVGIVRLRVSKWLPNAGAVIKVALFAGLGLLGAGSLLGGRPPANDFSAARFLPDWGDSLTFLPVLLYNALGFELMSSAGEEMRDPRRDVPRVILLSGLLIAAVYTLGVLGILLAVPVGELSLVTGTWDALVVLGRQWGAAGDAVVLVLGIGFLYACVANVVTWSLGVNRVAAAAAAEGALPSALGRLHPRFQTPHVAFVAMGLVSTALLVGNAALSARADNLFWMVFKLSGVCFLVSYLLLFPAFVVLRHRRPRQPRPYVMPGGPWAAWGAAGFCWLFVAGSCLLFFRPAPTAADPDSALRESWLLVAETVATAAVGLLLMPRVVGRERKAA